MTSYLIINSFKNPSPDVIFNADGQAKQNALLENRKFAHSDLLPITDRVKYSVGIKFPKIKKKIDIKFYLF